MTTQRQRGSGTIRKLKSGYQARYMDESGRQAPAPHKFATKADANLWLADRLSRKARGTWLDPRGGQVLLRDFGRSWLDTKDYTPKSREAAESLWRVHILPGLGSQSLNAITPQVVRSWRADRLKSYPPSKGKPTVRLGYNLLKAIMTTAVGDSLIPANPCVIPKASKIVSPKRPYLSYQQCMAIIGQMAPHLRLMAVVTWWSSMRVGEVLGLRWEDVDFQTGAVHIQRQVSQTAAGLQEVEPKAHSHRFVNIAGPGLEALSQHRAEALAAGPLPASSARVFTNRRGGELTYHAVNQAWVRARIKADQPRAHFHDMRASSATALLQSGATIYDVMAVLGHRTMAAAQSYQLNDDARKPVLAAGLAAYIAAKADEEKLTA